MAQATVEATPTHASADVSYSPVDADDTTDGHQVSLSAGINAVTVTAQDGATTQIYTVNVNRGVATDYGWSASSLQLDSQPPVIEKTRVFSDTLTLEYNEALNPGSLPAADDFTIRIVSGEGGRQSTPRVLSVAVTGNIVLLALEAKCYSGDKVSLSYVAGDGPIEDLAGNDAADLSNESIDNRTRILTYAFLNQLSLSGVDLSPPTQALSPQHPLGRLDYAATVPRHLSQTTVTAIPVANRATVAISPGDADASAPGHQVDLKVGETIIAVTVRYDDGVEDLTYKVTATRKPDPGSVPQDLAAVINDDGSITLNWRAPDDDSVTGYRILRRRPGEGEDTLLVYVQDTGSTATSYTDVDNQGH